ncbi:MAG TPA: hypothetical protein VGJ20_33590 [Xanthobacteraceae bacterium]
MIDTRHPIPKQFDDVYGEIARAVGVDPAAAIPEQLTAAEMAVASKRERERKAKRRGQRQARKRNRG